ncbi:MAG TPA: sigma-54 dependent transcriptional regulator [Pyrinomonadaceae bacterium]|nr:sigma-54 dependent transcriptional regulator [Pyrinomonadaceae bacterium]
MARVLIVDDETNMRRVLATILKGDGHVVTEAAAASEAIEYISTTPYDVVLTDQKMPNGDGLSVITASRDADPTLPVVMLTAFATVDLAVEAMRQGAFDFITKPFTPEVVLGVTRRATEHAELLRENTRLRGELERQGFSSEILGNSAAIHELKERIARVAPTNATVLITGETGTGKELVARAIHKQSDRANNSFVALNCAGFQETLLESELFGHERGAFTGADRSHQGLFESAHRGTMLLDEAGEMSLALQAKLLRVLVDGQVLRVGATSFRKIDVRVIVATHRDLLLRVKEGLFREDLYYRLAVVPIHIPPLRERKEDIPILVQSLLKQIAHELKSPVRQICPAAIDKLLSYGFPGNVRELRNLLERACILAQGKEIMASDLVLITEESKTFGANGPEDYLQRWLDSLPSRVDLRRSIEQIERELIVRALRAAQGVQAEAARTLDLSRSDVAYKIKKYALEGLDVTPE